MVSHPPTFYHMARGGVRFLQAICQLCIFRMLGSLVLSPEWQGWAPSGCYDSSPVFLGRKESSISCLSFTPFQKWQQLKISCFVFLCFSSCSLPCFSWNTHEVYIPCRLDSAYSSPFMAFTWLLLKRAKPNSCEKTEQEMALHRGDCLGNNTVLSLQVSGDIQTRLASSIFNDSNLVDLFFAFFFCCNFTSPTTLF